MSITRRGFLGGSAATAALAMGQSEAEASAMPKRAFGRSGLRLPIIGMGIAPLGGNGITAEEAHRVIHAAIDNGITYLDVSPDYGNAEAKLHDVMRTRRSEVFLVTKVNPRADGLENADSADGVQRQLEQSLARLGTDHVDAVHIHNLGDFDMERLLGPGGALDGLKKARARGLTRFIGTSGHMRPLRFVRAIETGDIDLTMNALNFADRNNYDFEGAVLPAARAKNVAIVAMKVLGGAVNWRYDGRTAGCLAAHYDSAVRYSLSLPGVSTAVIGLSSVAEVERAAAAARSYRPLSKSERTALLETGQQIARQRGLYYGPVTG